MVRAGSCKRTPPPSQEPCRKSAPSPTLPAGSCACLSRADRYTRRSRGQAKHASALRGRAQRVPTLSRTPLLPPAPAEASSPRARHLLPRPVSAHSGHRTLTSPAASSSSQVTESPGQESVSSAGGAPPGNATNPALAWLCHTQSPPTEPEEPCPPAASSLPRLPDHLGEALSARLLPQQPGSLHRCHLGSPNVTQAPHKCVELN